MAVKWQPIESVPDDGFFLVFEGGAMRMMYRSRGEWQASALAVDEHGQSRHDIRVRETGVYSPTHWSELPNAPEDYKPSDEG
jgi:hypothetical protein